MKADSWGRLSAVGSGKAKLVAHAEDSIRAGCDVEEFNCNVMFIASTLLCCMKWCGSFDGSIAAERGWGPMQKGCEYMVAL
jgi:hypothetical protein